MKCCLRCKLKCKNNTVKLNVIFAIKSKTLDVKPLRLEKYKKRLFRKGQNRNKKVNKNEQSVVNSFITAIVCGSCVLLSLLKSKTGGKIVHSESVIVVDVKDIQELIFARIYNVTVNEVLKTSGNASGVTIVTTPYGPGLCGVELKNGTDYLISGTVLDNLFHTQTHGLSSSLCGHLQEWGTLSDTEKEVIRNQFKPLNCPTPSPLLINPFKQQ
ncbi:hypothetical protein B4U80_14372 [Leptotrombidium deliense]|uniref:NTR domain-containing protein n=1 Tax=Leptotrombidium deliense TaxID=299467 RepID=A0A443RX52_9ACAR|nr:hypothetical protein B4U80_14372 [Leptotrombidium deliense]